MRGEVCILNFLTYQLYVKVIQVSLVLFFCGCFQVLLTSSEAVLSALHLQARSLFGNSHRLNKRRNGLGFDRQTVIESLKGV